MAALRPLRWRARSAATHPSQPHRSRSSAQTHGFSCGSDMAKYSALTMTFGVRAQTAAARLCRLRLQPHICAVQVHYTREGTRGEQQQLCNFCDAKGRVQQDAEPVHGQGKPSKHYGKAQRVSQAHHEQLPMLRSTAPKHKHKHYQSPVAL